MIQGDVVFTLKQNPHHLFKRVGDNLFIDLEITLEVKIHFKLKGSFAWI